MERSAFEQMARIDETHWWFTARRKILADVIATRCSLPNDARILEIGAGTGSNLGMLSQFGNVDPVEPDDEAAELAQKRSGLSVKRGLLPNGVDLEDGRYDLIALLDVLEHIEDDHGTLEFLKSKLAPDGKLLLAVPAMPWLWSAHDEEHHHKRRYTLGSLESVVRGAGYRTDWTSYFNFFLFPVVVGVRLIGKAFGASGGGDSLPSPAVNRVLAGIFGSERRLLRAVSLPVGVSILLVAGKA